MLSIMEVRVCLQSQTHMTYNTNLLQTFTSFCRHMCAVALVPTYVWWCHNSSYTTQVYSYLAYMCFSTLFKMLGVYKCV